jgi:hypothetical protein
MFLFLSMTPTRAINGRSRLMRAEFSTGTRKCRLSEEAHSLLGRRVCAYCERQRFHKTPIYLLKHFWASSFVNSNTYT